MRRALVPMLAVALTATLLSAAASAWTEGGVGSAPAAQAASATVPGTNGRIAFVSFRDGNEEVYVMNPDGTSQERITENALEDYDPVWHASGGRLYFTRNIAGSQPRIFLRDAARGTPETQITALGANAPISAPASAVTGALAFETQLHGGYEIYAVTAEGQARRLTNNDPISDRYPDWSPDGRQIVFWSPRTGNSSRDLFVMNADGTNVRQLTNYADSDREPSWSPDGRNIVYERRDPGNNEIYVIPAGGGTPRNLTNHPSSDRTPVWSPDGTKIAFVSSRDGDDEIFVMNADGTGVRQLTANTVSDDQPDWGLASQDADGDALLDDWERNGYDADGDKKIDVDLKKMGADPRHKDIFIEIDKMVGHHIFPQAVDRVVDAFARAPVTNPDGRSGITLHVDNGSGSEMNPRTGARWADLSKSNPLPHQDVLGSLDRNKNMVWTGEFEAIKKKNFLKARERIFHYVVSAHRFGSAKTENGGVSRDIGGSDLILSLGAFCPPAIDCAGSIEEQAGLFMHELGHNLGLRHGGVDHVNYKPNHLSVMNYTFNLTGLQNDAGTGVLDYSRSSPYSVEDTNKIATLFERRLDESVGMEPHGSYVEGLHAVYWCPPSAGSERKVVKVAAPTTDWNCNGRIETEFISADINGDKVANQTLASFNDWQNIVYAGGSIGALGASRPLPRATPALDAPHKPLVQAARILLADTKAPTVTITGPRRGRIPLKLNITARDDKGMALLIGMIGKKSYSFPARVRTRALGARADIGSAGVWTLRAAAVDKAGNRSRTLVVKVRASRR